MCVRAKEGARAPKVPPPRLLVVELELSMATQGKTIPQYGYTAAQYFIMVTRGNTILQYGYTGQHNTSVWAHRETRCFSMATQGNTVWQHSMATQVSTIINTSGYMERHSTLLWLHS